MRDSTPWRDFEKLIGTAEIILSSMVVISMLTVFSPPWRAKDDPSRPVEAAVSDIVGSALEAIASDDQLPDSELFSLMNLVISLEHGAFHDRGKDTALLVRDLPDRQWLNNLYDFAKVLRGTNWLRGSGQFSTRQFMTIPAEARERKLRRLAEAYRSGTPQPRMQIEQSLVSWEPVLQAVSDPQTIAAIWAAIPPHTNGPNLVAFPEAIRRLLLDSFLRNAASNSKAPTTFSSLFSSIGCLRFQTKRFVT
ncbi:hypothetical protein [Rhizobium leucaenae]|uniref:hypothetical protein n=1 Tax=Rhizobium leucaenae TaxID=29450 RepID=UPI0007EE8179|nr:hypothetical protein [Rhizobium leucaenae]MBB6305613.1 hypothetical protein [Rhizobium leucaenae]